MFPSCRLVRESCFFCTWLFKGIGLVSEASLIKHCYIISFLFYYWIFLDADSQRQLITFWKLPNPGHGCILTSHCESWKFSGTKLKASPFIQTILSFTLSSLKKKIIRVIFCKKKSVLQDLVRILVDQCEDKYSYGTIPAKFNAFG